MDLLFSSILLFLLSDLPPTNLTAASPLLDTHQKNCGLVVTAYDGVGPYTMAAIGVSTAMAIFLVLLAICRGSL